MNASKKIQKVLETPLLLPELTMVPTSGASMEEIALEEKHLGRPLSQEHRDLLHHWNGIGLEVIRFFGCGSYTGEIGRLSEYQIPGHVSPAELVIAADAAGFVYVEKQTGEVISIDTSSLERKEVARSIDDFVCRVIFGPDAKGFSGDEWEHELRENGVL